MSRHHFTAVGSNIYAGGFTLGVKQHFKVLAHLETSNYGVATMRLNQPEIPVYDDPETWPIEELRETGVDFIYGNPPCAAWSIAGYSKTRGTNKWLTDPRVDITRQYFGLIEKLKPTVWVWESVTQAFTKGRPFVDELTTQALQLGYAVTYVLYDTKWLGVPQSRKRFFMIVHRCAFNWLKLNWAPPITTGEALAEIKPIGPEWTQGKGSIQKLPLNKVFPGERLRNAWERLICPPNKQRLNKNGHVIGRPAFGHCRLHPDRPAGVMMGYAVVHPTEDRFLSINEYAYLSGYPNGYEFTPISAAGCLIGRGVCPPVGAWLAQVFHNGLRQAKPIKPEIYTLDLRLSPNEISAKGRPPNPQPGEGSGHFIRRLLHEGGHTDEELVVLVHQHYANRKTTIKDIQTNRYRMKKGR